MYTFLKILNLKVFKTRQYKTRCNYKYDLKYPRDGAGLASAERPFHDFAPLKEYSFCPLPFLLNGNFKLLSVFVRALQYC